MILGGTIFDLLENERGPEACERLVHELKPGGAVPTLEDAFDARFRDIEGAWRDHLRTWPAPVFDPLLDVGVGAMVAVQAGDVLSLPGR